MINQLRLFLFSLIFLLKLSYQLSDNDQISKLEKSVPFFCDRDSSDDFKKSIIGFFRLSPYLLIIFEKKAIIFDEPFVISTDFQNTLVAFQSFSLNNFDSTKFRNLKGIFKENDKNYAIRKTEKDAICCEIVFKKNIPDEQICTLCKTKKFHLELCTDSSRFCYFLRKTNQSNSSDFDQIGNEKEANFLFKYKNQNYENQKYENHLSHFKIGNTFIFQLNNPVKLATFNLDRVSKHPIAYEIDENNNLHLIEFEIKMDETNNQVIKFDYFSKHQISIDDFFGCIHKLRNFDQIYGIFYHRGHFYMILRQYYIKFKEDLVLNRFENLDETYLYENRRRFFFKDEKLSSNMYELTNIKWSLRISDKFYLQFCETDIFHIKFNRSNLILKRSSQITQIDCKWQMIEIHNKSYCFKSKYYHRMQINGTRIEKRAPFFKIEKIFVGFNYEENSLQFIFNYKMNSFVIMTNQKLFKIEFDKLKIQTTGELIYVHSELDVQENCIFKICTNEKRNRREPRYGTGSDEKLTESPNNESNYIKILLTILIVLIILTLIIVYFLCFHKRKSDFIQVASREFLAKSDSLQRLQSAKILKSSNLFKSSKSILKFKSPANLNFKIAKSTKKNLK